jgi:hypothetical protein
MADLGDHVADPGDHDRPIRAITIRRCMQVAGPFALLDATVGAAERRPSLKMI